MNSVTALHRRAMSLMDDAVQSRKEGDAKAANQQLRSAFEAEAEAANSLRLAIDAEPSRSILYRSAGSLAMQCGLYSEAEKLIYCGLAGELPISMEQELQTLLESVSFHRHLSLRGLVLSNVDIQVVL